MQAVSCGMLQRLLTATSAAQQPGRAWTATLGSAAHRIIGGGGGGGEADLDIHAPALVAGNRCGSTAQARAAAGSVSRRRRRASGGTHSVAGSGASGRSPHDFHAVARHAHFSANIFSSCERSSRSLALACGREQQQRS